ncbi:catechol 1,2-dioxygenase, partial [Lecanoromycetidae sp. Uapishka_2]
MPNVQEPLTLETESNLPQLNGDQLRANGQLSWKVENADASLHEHEYDPNFTQHVIDAMGPGTSPRMRKVMASLITHVHDFARENKVTVEEWMAGVNFLNEAGRMSTDVRNEGQLVTGVIGLESLVDEITYKLASSAEDAPTATAILGPFHIKNAPKLDMGSSIFDDFPNSDTTYLYGTVTDYITGKPIAGAELDVWQAAPNGLYGQQDPNQAKYNLRGRFTTSEDGHYNFYCLHPTSYPIPSDGPAGRLLDLMDRHHMRPGHIHFIVSAKDYLPVTTQIFDRNDKYLSNDSVFAVKDSLVVDFLPRMGDLKAKFELQYNFRLATLEEANKNSVLGTTEESAGNSL